MGCCFSSDKDQVQTFIIFPSDGLFETNHKTNVQEQEEQTETYNRPIWTTDPFQPLMGKKDNNIICLSTPIVGNPFRQVRDDYPFPGPGPPKSMRIWEDYVPVASIEVVKSF
jgi:hypothetical protein